MITRINKEEVKRDTDIVKLIGECVQLRKLGNIHRGLCPFHEERTASFTVYADTQSFHCFGCGAGGDSIRFVELKYGMTFLNALKYLSHRNNGHRKPDDAPAETIDAALPQKVKEKPDPRVLQIYEEIYPLCRQAILEDPGAKDVREYLALKRGIGPQEIEELQIGAYLPKHRDSVIKKYGAPLDGTTGSSLARMSGLVSYGMGYNYQIVLPHYGPDGKIAGLTFRILKEGRDSNKEPLRKYRHTPLLDKDYLFNLYQAAPFILEKGEVVIVEGHFDALTLILAGIQNVVCLGDTSISGERLKNLMAVGAGKVILWFDNDGPGEANARKVIKLLLFQNKVHVLVITCAFKDAGDINIDPNRQKIIENSLSSAELGASWLGRKMVEKCENDKDKINAMEEARDVYRQIPNLYLKKEFIKKVSRRLKVKMDYLTGDERKPKKAESGTAHNMPTLFRDLKTLVDKTDDIGAVGRYIKKFYSAQKGRRMHRDLREVVETMYAMVNRLEVRELREYILKNHAHQKENEL